MQTAPVDLNPPPAGRWRLPLALALAVHALLLLALSASVNWQREPADQVLQAQLWAQLPQAAPPLRPAAPTPEPTPAAPPPPAPAAEPAPVARPPTPAPIPTPAAPAPAAIAIEQQRERQRLEQRQEQQRAAAQRQAEQARQQTERERREQEAQSEADRQRELARILERAQASGAPAAREPAVQAAQAAQAAAPSAAYAARLVAVIRPNIVFTDVTLGNPRAEVELRTLPDGTIAGARLLLSSGDTNWDRAVLRAIERTARLPRDEQGRVPQTLILGFRPRE